MLKLWRRFKCIQNMCTEVGSPPSLRVCANELQFLYTPRVIAQIDEMRAQVDKILDEYEDMFGTADVDPTATKHQHQKQTLPAAAAAAAAAALSLALPGAGDLDGDLNGGGAGGEGGDASSSDLRLGEEWARLRGSKSLALPSEEAADDIAQHLGALSGDDKKKKQTKDPVQCIYHFAKSC